eukprot:gene25878-11550_t
MGLAADVVAAAAVLIISEGFAFETLEDKVVLNYTTQLCSDFYRVHGGVEQQLCNRPIAAMTTIETRTPSALPCIKPL